MVKMSESPTQKVAFPNQNSTHLDDWRVLAEQASKEQDPHRLLSLVQELCHALEQRDSSLRNPYLVHGRSAAIGDFLGSVIAATSADFGNAQLFDTRDGTLKIVTAHGFDSEFLHYFETVSTNEDCACGAAMRGRFRVVIADVDEDPAFSFSSREILRRANVRSLQSTPLLDASGTLLGMVSTHYRQVNGPRPAMWDAVDNLTAKFVRQIA
jgi:GAF domain-containing protein